MLIFLSWSGSRSKAVASILNEWLPQVMQAVVPWMSADIDKGARWGPEISDGLEQSKIGIICLTKDNLDANWILFEAGAISKTKEAHVCTFLLDVKPSDVEPPLGQFQHTQVNQDDVLRLVKTINEKIKSSNELFLEEARLIKQFNTFWPELEEKLSQIASQATPVKRGRSQNEVMEEMLELLRRQENQQKDLTRSLNWIIANTQLGTLLFEGDSGNKLVSSSHVLVDRGPFEQVKLTDEVIAKRRARVAANEVIAKRRAIVAEELKTMNAKSNEDKSVEIPDKEDETSQI